MAFPFIFGGTWLEKTAEFLPRIRSRGNTVIGNDAWIGREAVIMPHGIGEVVFRVLVLP